MIEKWVIDGLNGERERVERRREKSRIGESTWSVMCPD